MMQHRPDKRAQHEIDTKSYNIDQASSQGWHFGIGDNFLLSNVEQRNRLIMPTSNQLNFLQFGGQTSEVPSSVCRQEHGSVVSSILPPKMGEYLVPETQQDQASPSYSYLEPNSRDSTLAQGRPQLIYPELHGVPHYEATSPYVVPEEPVYVNAKQYHAILRRRQLRAKAEVKNKLRTVRKPYLHESRHLHALRRVRGCGGRFVNTKKPETSTRNATDEERNGIGDSPALKKLCSESDSGFSSAVPSGKAETSTSVNDFKKLSLEGSNCAEFFQWRSYCS